MNEKPILFSGSMVKAILEGRKTQTRRVVKPQPTSVQGELKTGGMWLFDYRMNVACPYGKPGEFLWVRETWLAAYARTEHSNGCVYLADYGHRSDLISQESAQFSWKWKPSIYMPRWASRITLEITKIRVERVQEITVDDCIAETGTTYPGREQMLQITPINPESDAAHIRNTFFALWESINAKRGFGWEAKPWVWVIEFKPAGECR